jgi:hypothetical protein
MSKEDILRAIAQVTDPKVMTSGEALEFLEDIRHDVNSRIDAILADMKAKGQDWPPPKLRPPVP